MKYFAIFTVLLLIVSLVGVGYLYMTANVVVEATGVIAMEADDQPELFSRLRDQVRTGAVIGTPYVSASELGEAENYQFYTYTIRLRNDCYVAADTIEVQITPMAGDVLQIGAQSSYVIGARSTGDVQATILTAAGMHPIREVTVSYYMWGLPFTLKTTVQ
ncbi:MAG: hypothetical protein IJ438_03950 [Clostridia bacterium]|nr:hypothetical protein [Clostridia bacterium]